MEGIEKKKTRRMKSGKSLQTKGEEQIDGRSKETRDEADRVQGTMRTSDLTTMDFKSIAIGSFRAMTRTPRLPSTCTKIPTHAACHLVQWFGDSSQKSQKPKQDAIGFHPALNQTVIQEYNKLYKECAGFRKPITSCAYNHMVCTLEMLPQDRYNQEYTDCRDQLVNCINESAKFLEMRKSTVCAAQLDIALEVIKDDARVSGMSADYFYVNINTTTPDIQ
ncbi:hypothetical protein B9Z55_013421 [Caenorhabditis nigoni]|nr:hypothetical protein B9Z55_013421 [Caenorhabditis nigoni]